MSLIRVRKAPKRLSATAISSILYNITEYDNKLNKNRLSCLTTSSQLIYHYLNNETSKARQERRVQKKNVFPPLPLPLPLGLGPGRVNSKKEAGREQLLNINLSTVSNLHHHLCSRLLQQRNATCVNLTVCFSSPI